MQAAIHFCKLNREFVPRSREPAYLRIDVLNGRPAAKASSDGYDGAEVPPISPQHKQRPRYTLYGYPRNFAKRSWAVAGTFREKAPY
jgi:hypothetical protein